ncbi:MAG: hypothetical protein ACI8QZ_003108 [Chlamydiales bacterium]
MPSGSEAKGLGSGEVGLAPSLSAWIDLGNWFQAAALVGTEYGLESGDAQLSFGGALAYSFKAPVVFGLDAHGHAHGTRHFPAGLTSAIVEITGRSILEGGDAGRDTAEALFGLSYALNGSYGIRGGYPFPIGGQRGFDNALILSLVYHF